MLVKNRSSVFSLRVGLVMTCDRKYFSETSSRRFACCCTSLEPPFIVAVGQVTNGKLKSPQMIMLGIGAGWVLIASCIFLHACLKLSSVQEGGR